MGLGDEKRQFVKRIKKLERKDRAFDRGFETMLRADGLLIVKPRRRGFGISGKSVFVFLAAFLLFKGLAVAHLGPVTYEERVAQLNSGTFAEKAAAWVMTPDPVSVFVANTINPYLK
jgi:hypothetical protein